MSELKQITFAEILSVSLGILAGSLLLLIKSDFNLIPGLLVIVPGLLQMRGSVTTLVASRISTSLHLGTLTKRELNENIILSLSLSIISSIIIGVTGILFVFLLSKKIVFVLLFTSIFVGVVSSFIDILLVVYPEVKLFDKGVDPDNIMGPYISSIDDFITLALILVMLWIF